jgi:predicted transcriptional regulator
MEKLNYRQRLDIILACLRNHNNEIKYGGLITLLALSYKLDLRESAAHFERLIKKLELDGFVSVNKVDTYFITLDGYYFKGYEYALEVENEKLHIIEENENQKVRREDSLKNATWFAGFAALFLLLFQIYTSFWPHC